jgi:predicted neuraminidase
VLPPAGNPGVGRARGLPAWVLLLGLVLVFAMAFQRAWTRPAGSAFVVGEPGAAPARGEKPEYASQLLPKGEVASVHAATAVALGDGRLRAFWYGGSREGAADVRIFSSVYSPRTGEWSAARPVVTRETMQRALGRNLRKLGNPVAGRDGRGRLWLFFVSVSFGGWSGSAINALTSSDEGESWSEPRRLVTSPFLNLSNLVKAAPVPFADGTLGLPVYHEMFGKFGESLRLDAGGSVIGKTRLSWGRHSLQPVVVPLSGREAVSFMRYAGEPPKRVLMQGTTDAGLSWSEPVKTALPNPNAAIDSVRLADGALLLAFNNSDHNREDLSLAWSGDQGRSWRVVHVFDRTGEESGEGMPEYSYPWLMTDSGGDVHVLYTWRRARIKHVRFNPSWLEERLK